MAQTYTTSVFDGSTHAGAFGIFNQAARLSGMAGRTRDFARADGLGFGSGLAAAAASAESSAGGSSSRSPKTTGAGTGGEVHFRRLKSLRELEYLGNYFYQGLGPSRPQHCGSLFYQELPDVTRLSMPAANASLFPVAWGRFTRLGAASASVSCFAVPCGGGGVGRGLFHN